MPNEVAARVPQTKDYRYAVTNDRVLLVSSPTRVVVGVFTDGAGQAGTVGAGQAGGKP